MRAFLSAGVRLIQLRAKTWESGAFLDLAQAAVADADAGGRAPHRERPRRRRGACPARTGCTSGQDDLSPADARDRGRRRRLAWPVDPHRAQWTAALDAPISYVAIGPVFGTGTKATGYQTGRPGDRDAVVAAAAGARDLPVVAIGGITLDRAAAVIAAGASSVAVISDLMTGSRGEGARVRPGPG